VPPASPLEGPITLVDSALLRAGRDGAKRIRRDELGTSVDPVPVVELVLVASGVPTSGAHPQLVHSVHPPRR
jgi:hypothetical protein